MVSKVLPRTAPQPVKPFLAIALKILSALAFTLMSAGVKTVSAAYPTGEIVSVAIEER